MRALVFEHDLSSVEELLRELRRECESLSIRRTSSLEGLAHALLSERFDLVVVPEKLCRLEGALEPGWKPPCPVIALTAHAAAGERPLPAGIRSVSWPGDIGSLSDAIREALRAPPPPGNEGSGQSLTLDPIERKRLGSIPAAACILDTNEGRIRDANTLFAGFVGYSTEELVGRKAQDLGLWVYPSNWQRLQRKLLSGTELLDMPSILRRKSGDTLSALMSLTLSAAGERGGAGEVMVLLQHSSWLAKATWLAQQPVDKPGGNAGRRVELLRHFDRLCGAGLEQTVEESLHRQDLLETVRELVDAENAALLFRHESGSDLEVRAAVGVGSEELTGAILRGALQAQPSPTRSPSVFEAVLKEGAGTAPEGKRRPLTGLPVYVGQEFLGMLCIGIPKGAKLPHSDAQLFLLLAERIVPVFHRTVLLEKAQAEQKSLRSRFQKLLLLQERERRSLGRELHDDLGQLLTSLKLMLQGPGAGGEPTPPAASTPPDAKVSATVLTILDEMMERVRNLSVTLRPPPLEDFGLVPALLDHFKRYTARTGIRVRFRPSGISGRFHPTVETIAFRIVQESLTNVAKHARTADAEVSLEVSNGWLRVLVSDAGVGFNCATPEEVMGGLGGMRERARLLGGRFKISSQPGSGTRVAADLPLLGPSAKTQPP